MRECVDSSPPNPEISTQKNLDLTPSFRLPHNASRIETEFAFPARQYRLGGGNMADKGKGDKAKKEPKKKAALTLKEKRKMKNDKKSSD